MQHPCCTMSFGQCSRLTGQSHAEELQLWLQPSKVLSRTILRSAPPPAALHAAGAAYLARSAPATAWPGGSENKGPCLVVPVHQDAQLLRLRVLLGRQRVAYLGRQLPAQQDNACDALHTDIIQENLCIPGGDSNGLLRQSNHMCDGICTHKCCDRTRKLQRLSVHVLPPQARDFRPSACNMQG